MKKNKWISLPDREPSADTYDNLAHKERLLKLRLLEEKLERETSKRREQEAKERKTKQIVSLSSKSHKEIMQAIDSGELTTDDIVLAVSSGEHVPLETLASIVWKDAKLETIGCMMPVWITLGLIVLCLVAWIHQKVFLPVMAIMGIYQ